MIKLTLLFIFLITAIGINAQTFNKQKLDSLFTLLSDNDKIMVGVSVFQEGIEIYQNSIGYADMANNIKANAGTKYRIGSISKVFTSTIIMQLMEEGKLSLDTKLEKFFPEIPNAGEITIEHLLRHRSGLFNFTSREGHSEWSVKPHTRKEILNCFIENGTVFEPGEKMEYSNTNFVLLSYIIEKIEGKDFSEALKARISGPCGLDNTYYGGKINTANNEAKSYRKMADWELANETDMSIPTGAGGIVSTPTGLNQFLIYLFEGKLVSDGSLEKMKTMVDGYGLGLMAIPFYEKISYGHGGAIDAFGSSASYFPEEKMAVAGIKNGGNYPLNDMMIGVLSIIFGKEYKLSEFTPPIEVSSEELEKFEGLYSGPALPIKLNIFVEDGILKGQGTGQPSFPMEAYEKNKFRYELAGAVFEFVPEEDKLILKQGGGTFELRKE